jgi:GNAT superfamily N-acetyltransferase
MMIKIYIRERDEAKLMQMLEEEGEEWACYWKGENAAKYREALAKSITYVAYEGEEICGFSRSLDDYGFYIYVCDLLVRSSYRGKGLGHELMECLPGKFPGQTVYVMSDVDEYYIGLGYPKEGSVFLVKSNK